jgi:hypothetical protein
METMVKIGSKISNQYYEHALPAGFVRPTHEARSRSGSISEIKKFIQNKYERKLFVPYGEPPHVSIALGRSTNAQPLTGVIVADFLLGFGKPGGRPKIAVPQIAAQDQLPRISTQTFHPCILQLEPLVVLTSSLTCWATRCLPPSTPRKLYSLRLTQMSLRSLHCLRQTHVRNLDFHLCMAKKKSRRMAA